MLNNVLPSLLVLGTGALAFYLTGGEDEPLIDPLLPPEDENKVNDGNDSDGDVNDRYQEGQDSELRSENRQRKASKNERSPRNESERNSRYENERFSRNERDKRPERDEKDERPENKDFLRNEGPYSPAREREKGDSRNDSDSINKGAPLDQKIAPFFPGGRPPYKSSYTAKEQQIEEEKLARWVEGDWNGERPPAWVNEVTLTVTLTSNPNSNPY
jgi:hypothetical protein